MANTIIALQSPHARWFDEDGRPTPETFRLMRDLASFRTAFRAQGYGAVTGSVSRAAFNTGTITHADLAQVVGALVTDWNGF